MATDREQILKIVEALERVSGRPMMFAGAKTMDAVGAFLSGFDVACHALGLNIARGIRYKVETDRGWESNAMWIIPQMRERGMTEESMMDEMLSIEIQMWRLTADKMPDERV